MLLTLEFEDFIDQFLKNRIKLLNLKKKEDISSFNIFHILAYSFTLVK